MENEIKTKFSLKGIKKHFLPVLLLVFFGFVLLSSEAKAFLFWSEKESAKVYPAEISGNWERTRNAQGQANVSADGEGDEFSQYNSAIYREGAKSLIFGGFFLVDDEAPIKSEEEEIIDQAEQWLEENDPSFEAEKEKDPSLEAEKAIENNPEEQEIEVLSEPEAGAEEAQEISPKDVPAAENISPEGLPENENSTENLDSVSFWKKIPTFLRGEIAWAKEQFNFAQLSSKKFSSASLKLSLAVLEKRAGEVVVETEEDKELGEGIVPVAKLEDVDLDSMAIIYYSQDGENWTKLGAISYAKISNGQNGEYFSYSLPFIEKWEDFHNLQVRVDGVVGGEVDSAIYLDSLWVEAFFEESDVKIIADDIELSGEKTDWRMGEKPKFKISQRTDFFSQIRDFVLFWKPDVEVGMKIFSASRGEFELEEGKDYVIENKDEIVIRFISTERISPGKYTLQATFQKGDFSKTMEQDFTWGVLAMNANKSIYAPRETGALSMAVLDENGSMVCDAQVTLRIRNEKLNINDELSTENGKIKVNPECELKDFTLKPDYAASYDFGAAGNYALELEALTKKGVYSITDNIEVKKNVLFDVERITATRIYPPASYPVTLRISANKDFKGEVRETVPASFSISKLEKSNMVDFVEERTEGEERTLIWNIVLKKGESVSLGYRFDAPDVSPELYLLGPLQFFDKNLGLDFMDRLVFSEAREWQIAADAVAPNGLLIYSDSTTASTKYRTLTNPTTLGSETSDGLGLSTDASNEVLKYSPTKNEFIAGQQHDDGKIVVRTFDGSSWTTQMNLSGLVATSRVDRRAFDIEYERMSGEAMWIYADDPTTGRVYYCIYDGNSWGPVSNCAPTNGTNDIVLNDGTTALTGVPTKIKLKKGRPGSNGLWLQVEDANADLYVAHWDGSSWVAADDITASTALSCDDADTSAPYVDHGSCFGLGVESLSEDPVLFYTEAATMYYRTFNRGTSTWSSPVSGLTLSSDGNWLFVSSDEESDRMAVASGAQGNDFRPIIWKADGTTAGLTSGNADTGAESMAGNNVDGFWEKRPGNATRLAMFVYTDSNALKPSYETATCTSSGCSFSTIAAVTATSDCADDCSSLLLRGNPNGNDMILTGSDIDGDLAMWRWSGSAWALLQKNLSTAGYITPHTSADTTNYTEFPHWYEYYAYSPWSHNWRWYDDEASATPTSALANENVAPSGVESANALRLRMSIINPTGAGQTDARKKLQYSTDQSTWTDVDAQAGSGIWRYCNGGGTDDSLISAYTLTAPSTPLSTNRQYGPYVENGTAASAFDHTAVYTAEFDYCVENNGATSLTTYYFRAFDNDQNDPVDKFQASYPATSCAGSVACSYPSLTTASLPEITVSGGCFTDATESTACADDGSNEIKVAVNGSLASGSDTTVDGSWSFSLNQPSTGAILTFFINSEDTESEEATTVVKYDGSGNVDLVKLYQSHLVIGADSGSANSDQTIANADLDPTGNGYDNTDDEDVLFSYASQVLTVDDDNNKTETLYVISGDTFRPDSAGGDTVNTNHLYFEGTLTADNNTINVAGNFTNAGTFTSSTSTITFNGGAAQTFVTNSSAYNNITFNNSGADGTTDDLVISGALDINGTFNLTNGDLKLDTNNPNLNTAGDVTISSSAFITKGTGTWTFDGVSGTHTFTDSSTGGPQDLGAVTIDNSATGNVLSTASNLKLSSLNITADDTLDISGDTLTISGSGSPFTKSGTFTTTGSTVIYAGTTASNIAVSNYNNLTLTPASGTPTYSLAGNLTSGNALTGNLTISSGATLDTTSANSYGITLAGSWSNAGTFTRNSSTITFNGTTAGLTISDGGSPFYDLAFSGTGGEWLYRDGASTAPNQTSVTAGTVNFFNAKTGTRSVTGGTLNVDWYLGTHVVNKNNTDTDIDTGDNDITISEVGSNNAVWSWSSSSNLALTTVDTSASLTATGYGNYYTWYDGSRYWLGFINNIVTSNAAVEYWYSESGSSWTQNTNATISITNMNSSSFPNGANMDCDGSNCFAFYNQNATPSLYAVKAASYPGTGFSWGSATQIYAGVAFSYGIVTPQVARDGDDKFHVTFTRAGTLSDVGAIHERFATNANDISTWGTTNDLEAYDETRRKVSRICRLAGNDMYYIVANMESGAIEGKKYVSGTGWDSSATTVVSDGYYTAETGTMLQFPSLVGNTATDEAYLLYINSSNNVVFKKYIDGSGWQTAVTLDSGTSSIIPKLTFNSVDSSLYAFWVSGNKVYYKKGTGSFGSSDWDSSATELADPGTITSMSTSKEVQNGYITFAITTGTGSPYDVKFMGLAAGESSWNSGSSKTTGTDSTGKNPQPENDRSLRIREASITSTATCPGAGCTLYRYNLAATAQAGYNAYNYYSDYGSKYLTSCWANGASCSNDTTNDDVIGDSWHRSAMGTMNSPYTTVNEPSTNGSWYVGLTPTATGVTVSGTVWTNEAKTTNIGANKTVHLFVNGTDKSTAETDANGAFTFSSITVAANDSVVVYLDEETENGSSVTLALDDTTDITSLDIITDHITLDHRSTGPITNTDLDDIDAVDAENEDGVAIATGNATFASGLELVINTNKTYTPGGTVTTNASATSSSQDGDIYIQHWSHFQCRSQCCFLWRRLGQ